MTKTSILPSRGSSVPTVASMAKVPLPWTGTQTWLPLAPAMSTSRSRTRAFSAMKSVSREPQSRSIASRVVREVVNGPGVRRSGSRSLGMAEAPVAE